MEGLAVECPHCLGTVPRAPASITLQSGRRTEVVAGEHVKALVADHKCVRVIHTRGCGLAESQVSLRRMAAAFPTMLRISRAALVNPRYIDTVTHQHLEHGYNGAGLTVTLAGERERLGVSRRHAGALRRWLRSMSLKADRGLNLHA